MNPEVDRYIEAAAAYAQPILRKVRELYHQCCPDVVETIKWGVPHFEHNGILGNMAAFKQHVSYGFWKGMLMQDSAALLTGIGRTEMAAGKVSTMDDLPNDAVLLSYIMEAMHLNETKQPSSPAKKAAAARPTLPADLEEALAACAEARKFYMSLSPSQQREYVDWLTEAKRETTRRRRLATILQWLAEGKTRNWKYEGGVGTSIGG